MSQLTIAHFEQIIAACTNNRAAIAQSFNLCFDRGYRLEVGESTLWTASQAPAELEGPGLTVSFQVGTAGLLCVVPERLPLPEWYRAPGESENSRLQTLAMEWAMTILPPDLEASAFRTEASESLSETIAAAEPAPESGLIALLLYDEAGEGTEPAGQLYLVGPVEKPPAAVEVASSSMGAASSPPSSPMSGRANAGGPAAASASAASGMAAAAAGQRRGDHRRLLKLPVTVSVRLAERKIEMGQLLAITPGALITFNKSCEDLLDLYVNNHPYCRGEAVKIGEKFGLKVNQVGFTEERPVRVL